MKLVFLTYTTFLFFCRLLRVESVSFPRGASFCSTKNRGWISHLRLPFLTLVNQAIEDVASTSIIVPEESLTEMEMEETDMEQTEHDGKTF